MTLYVDGGGAFILRYLFEKSHISRLFFIRVLKKFLFSEFPQIITNNSHSSIAISIKVL